MTTTDTVLTVDRRAADGSTLGTVTLDPTIFGVPVNVPLIHQVVTAQLAGRRAGTQSTRTRAEVKGGSAKPFRQKGTGNARQGSIRAPHYAGGGIALGPKPRSYAQKTPKKMIQQALRCALSDRAREGGLRLVSQFGLDAPRTKAVIAILDALQADGRVLVVVGREDEHAIRSFANVSHVVTVPADQLTAYDVLCADVVVFTDDTLPGDNVVSASAPKAAPAKRTPTPRAAAPAAEEPAEVADEADLAAGDAPIEAEAPSADAAEEKSDDE